MFVTAYLREPPWARHAQRAIFATEYVLVSFTGLLTTLLTHTQPQMTYIGWILIVTGISGVFGVLSGFYRFEWVGLSPMVAALLCAGILVYPRSSLVVITLIFALSLSMMSRLLHLTLVASRLRKLPGERVHE